jgi:hypothetical protein
MKKVEINLSVYDRPRVRRFYKRLCKDFFYRKNNYTFGIEARIITATVPEESADDFYEGLNKALAIFFPNATTTRIKNESTD